MPPSMLTALRTAMSGVVILSIAYYSRQKEQEQLSISAASGREVAAEVQSSEESSEVGTSDRAEVPLLARTLPGVVPAGIGGCVRVCVCVSLPCHCLSCKQQLRPLVTHQCSSLSPTQSWGCGISSAQH